MKKYLLSLMLFAATLGLASSAAAVVIPGSTYSVYLEGSASGTPFIGLTQFDGVAASTERDGLTLLLNESETSLGGKNSLISIDLRANGDLFPVPNETAILAIGSEDPLDFITRVTLYDARVILFDANNTVLFSSDNLVDLAVNNMPWDGAFPAPSSAFGIDEIGGMGVTRITFNFSVTELPAQQVPEPGSILLSGMGLVILALRRRGTGRA